MPGEVDAEHLVRLTLVPARPGIHRAHARRRAAASRGTRVRSSTESTWPTAGRRQVHDDGEALVELVDGGQVVEEAAAEDVAGGA